MNHNIWFSNFHSNVISLIRIPSHLKDPISSSISSFLSAAVITIGTLDFEMHFLRALKKFVSSLNTTSMNSKNIIVHILDQVDVVTKEGIIVFSSFLCRLILQL